MASITSAPTRPEFTPEFLAAARLQGLTPEQKYQGDLTNLQAIGLQMSDPGAQTYLDQQRDSNKALVQNAQIEGAKPPIVGFPNTPLPINFISGNNPDGTLNDAYKTSMNTQGLERGRELALSQGFNPWTSLAMQNRQVQGRNDQDNSKRQVAMANLQAMKNTPGALGALSSLRNASQGVLQNHLNTNSDLSKMTMQGQQDRVSSLNTQATNEIQAMQPTQMNIKNQMGQQLSQNIANMGQYQQQMQAWGAKQQSGAIQSSGKK